MKNRTALLLAAALFFSPFSRGQIPFSFEKNALGQAVFEVPSKPDYYFLLRVRHDSAGLFSHATAFKKSENGPTTRFAEPLPAYPKSHYEVLETPFSAPRDEDRDGLDDLAEMADLPQNSPINRAKRLDPSDGQAFLPDRAAFEKLSYRNDPNFQVAGTDGLEVVKFYVLDRDSAYPQLYFLNPKWATHNEFAAGIGEAANPSKLTGLLIFHPDVVAPNGQLGVYRFNFQPHNAHPFRWVEKTAEMLAANAPFLAADLCYYPYAGTSLPLYFQEKALFDASRVCAIFDDDLYGDLDYQAMHLAEGFGFLRKMAAGETPSSRDVVILESLPNALPRVAGIISTVSQTPLAHVNLRAIQDDVPNAFVRKALETGPIEALLGQFVFFKTEKDSFQIRSASQQEVDDFFETKRPAEPLRPVRDLAEKRILPLDSLGFADAKSFGAKCANVAEMRRFGFPDGTIPDGFGVPFSFFDEFMRFNGFYQQAEDLQKRPDFQTDLAVRAQLLDDFRKKIRAGALPNSMRSELEKVQKSFPPDRSIRCRSSSNCEDLPSFAGAGLYDSKTHRPDEGHLEKSIKEVWASLWNFRAFEEREFFRIDHAAAAMGVLIHPNSENERANGVGVTLDPFFGSKNTFYLNAQVGENLVTNPSAAAQPEEILVFESPQNGQIFVKMEPSSLIAPDSSALKKDKIEQLRDHLSVIRDRFKKLYEAENADGFAMEIEFKIEANGLLLIKQARPWAGFWASFEPPEPPADSNAVGVFPNPFLDVLKIQAPTAGLFRLRIFDAAGRSVFDEKRFFEKTPHEISAKKWPSGPFAVLLIDEKTGRFWAKKAVK